MIIHNNNSNNDNIIFLGLYMQQKYNIKTIESFYDLKIDIQGQFFKLGSNNDTTNNLT